ncbi:Telomerase reverse transcriptase [Trichoplax sp. H2]|nr:Telomerase reverse transcriptase [Trichoplax sp. H2]|eukprot:RDD47422.1 Telomerase reverse transcriptase [Trichoplax sp. H2]
METCAILEQLQNLYRLKPNDGAGDFDFKFARHKTNRQDLICSPLAILKSLYDEVVTLNIYLRRDDSPFDFVLRPSDYEEYQNFLCHTLVGLSAGQLECYHVKIRNEKEKLDISGTIEHVIQQSLCSKQRPSHHILSLGRTKMGAQICKNSAVEIIQSPVWNTLFSRIDHRSVIHLLKDTAIFIPFTNTSLLQVTGCPINRHMYDFHAAKNPVSTSGPYQCTERSNEELPIKKQCLYAAPAGYRFDHTGAEGTDFPFLSSIDVPYEANYEIDSEHTPVAQSHFNGLKVPEALSSDIKTSQLFFNYKLLFYIVNNHRLIYFLLRKHKTHTNTPTPPVQEEDDLNREAKYCRSSLLKLSTSITRIMYSRVSKESLNSSSNIVEVAHSSRRGARKLITRIFLSNQIHQSKYNKKGTIQSCRLPRRLIRLQQIFQSFIKRHKKCRFQALLHRQCPLKPHQIFPIEASQTVNINCKKRTETKVATNYSCLRNNYSTPVQVYSFLVSVCNHVIPQQLWGCKRNKQLFYNKLFRFIHLHKNEKFTCRDIMMNMKISECIWANNFMQKAKLSPISNSEKSWRLCTTFFWWLFNDYCLSILKGYFYVTDSDNTKNKIFYYRKSIWRRILTLGVTGLLREKFKKIDKKTYKKLLHEQKTLGCSGLRFLPKDKKLRPIIALNRKTFSSDVMNKTLQKSKGSHCSNLPINDQLRKIFNILTYEKNKAVYNKSPGIFGFHDIYYQWKNFISNVNPQSHDRKWYFASVDIKNCFDSIRQEKLLSIVDKLLNQDEYLMYQFTMVSRRNNKNCSNIQRYILKNGDMSATARLLKFSENESNSRMRHCIVYDKAVIEVVKKTFVLEQIKKHITNNIVQVNGEYYKQTSGIPQGSILSSVLCYIFYNMMENTYLKEFMNQSNVFFARLTDDFLLVANNKDVCCAFINKMAKGIPEYGCELNLAKCLVNEKLAVMNDFQPNLCKNSSYFPWCGLLFNINTLEVLSDYNRYTHIRISECMTINISNNAGQTMRAKMLQYVRMLCQIITLDPEMNSKLTIGINIFDKLQLIMLKFLAYVHRLPKGKKPNSSVQYFDRKTPFTQYNKFNVVFATDCIFNGNNNVEFFNLMLFEDMLMDMIHCLYITARRCCRKYGVLFCLEMDELIWLGVQAACTHLVKLSSSCIFNIRIMKFRLQCLTERISIERRNFLLEILNARSRILASVNL